VDLELQAGAGAAAVERLLARPDAEDLVDDRGRAPAHAGRDVGAAVRVVVLRHPPHDVQARVLLRQRQLQVGVVLVVPQTDVVTGLVPLDEVVLEGQGLHLGVGQDQVEVGDLAHEVAQERVRGPGGLEVLADAVPQQAGLAHVEDPPLLVLEQVHAGPRGHGLELFLQAHQDIIKAGG